MASDSEKSLYLTVSGRIIDSLGIQMYQSPVAAIAEIISNAWDADAARVRVTLPDELSEDAEIVVADNGIGMTFSDCQERYLKVGWCRRGDDPSERSPEKRRPILGRKGIGKFAGFGIAGIICVQTVSKNNGERTVFELEISTLRTEEYVATGGEVSVIEHLEPEDGRRAEHGTSITLRRLKLGRRPSPASFAKSMARRFSCGRGRKTSRFW
jgi:HSP90 family molecular chaperone